MYWRRVFWCFGLKDCHVHRAEVVLWSPFLFVASLGHCIVTFKVTHRERSLKTYNISLATSCAKSLLTAAEKGWESWGYWNIFNRKLFCRQPPCNAVNLKANTRKSNILEEHVKVLGSQGLHGHLYLHVLCSKGITALVKSICRWSKYNQLQLKDGKNPHRGCFLLHTLSESTHTVLAPCPENSTNIWPVADWEACVAGVIRKDFFFPPKHTSSAVSQ